MLLYTKIVGRLTSMNATWEDHIDDYDNNYFNNASMKQKIKISKNVSTDFTCKMLENDTSCYELDDYVRFGISNKNLNLSLIKAKSPKSADENLCYFVIYGWGVKGYKLHGNTKILQTMSGGYKNYHRGCVLSFSNSDELLMTVKVQKFKNGGTDIYDLKCIDGVIEFVPHAIETEEDEADIIWHTADRFYVTTVQGRIPTAAILVNSATSPEYKLVDEVAECVKDVKNAAIVPLPGSGCFEKSNFTEEENAGIETALDNALSKERNRAVTLVGLKGIPKDFFKKYKISYVFELDVETGYIINTKSN